MNVRYLLYGLQILLGLVLTASAFVDGEPLMALAWLVVVVSGAALFWNDRGGSLAV